ncbi:hypothetical protein KM176_07585 [Pseudooceanicola sp. CBS1P-1]|uniref:Uncharacterized protein n=1 Tax=Pseudooceanicola albus TaxID=2692189 RepID=A0A6L7G289_9RHOB|nr:MULTISPECIES: DUF6476 family protein [Pseudooceanicola]MBT9383713.1 hypothetical protein [Pseudooceanicola endophyticus]MXN17567.1 hypothetical protein [Pseudooceanicola albus]
MAQEETSEYQEPANLRLLRRLVTLLMVVMIIGVVSIVGLVVIRFSATPEPLMPDSLTLPAGATAEAVTVGTGWVAVVTKMKDGKERILVFDATTGSLRQSVDLTSD